MGHDFTIRTREPWRSIRSDEFPNRAEVQGSSLGDGKRATRRKRSEAVVPRPLSGTPTTRSGSVPGHFGGSGVSRQVAVNSPHSDRV